MKINSEDMDFAEEEATIERNLFIKKLKTK